VPNTSVPEIRQAYRVRFESLVRAPLCTDQQPQYPRCIREASLVCVDAVLLHGSRHGVDDALLPDEVQALELPGVVESLLDCGAERQSTRSRANNTRQRTRLTPLTAEGAETRQTHRQRAQTRHTHTWTVRSLRRLSTTVTVSTMSGFPVKRSGSRGNTQQLQSAQVTRRHAV
jgi:hypothetical protein